MEVAQLRYFVALVETGSVTRASKRVYVSQPAVSLAMRHLEEELGVVLVERRGRGVRITADGLRFYRRARTILDEYRAAKSELREASEGRPVRLGILGTLPAGWVTALTQRLRGSDRGPGLELFEGLPAELSEWLHQKRVDATLTDIAMSGAHPHQHLLLRDRFVAITAPSHALVGQSSVDLEELHGHPYVLRTHCEALPDGNEVFKAKGVRPHIVCRTSTDSLALELVAAGFGLTVLPESLAGHGVHKLPVRDFHRQRQLGLEWTAATDPAVVDALIEAARIEPRRRPA